MNKSKRARWCNPLEEGSTAEEVGGGGVAILGTTGEGSGGWRARSARTGPGPP